jgi:hypothetical protein
MSATPPGSGGTRSGRRTTKNAPSRFAPSSGFPIDLRRSGCRSGDHQPPVLRSRCTRESRGCNALRQVPERRKCAICARSHSRCAFTSDARDSIRIVASSFAIELRTNKKCTGAVAPSSGFLTDLRRSGCRSGDHQPQVLLPRCNHHSRGWRQGGQGPVGSEFPQIANFASGAAANCALRIML